MTRLITVVIGAVILCSSCHLLKKPVTSGEVIGSTPIASGPVDTKPTHGAISDTAAAIDNTGSALAQAESEAAAAKREADQAQVVIVSYEDLVNDLRKTNQVMASKFDELGRKHRELEVIRIATIKRLTTSLTNTHSALDEAEESNDIARDRIFQLEGDSLAQTIELREYRKKHEVVAQALKDAEVAYAKEIAKERKKADKAVKDNAKYKGYYDMAQKIFWVGVVLVVIAGVIFYIRNFTALKILG